MVIECIHNTFKTNVFTFDTIHNTFDTIHITLALLIITLWNYLVFIALLRLFTLYSSQPSWNYLKLFTSLLKLFIALLTSLKLFTTHLKLLTPLLTHTLRAPSTWRWQFWNGRIQMKIRWERLVCKRWGEMGNQLWIWRKMNYQPKKLSQIYSKIRPLDTLLLANNRPNQWL